MFLLSEEISITKQQLRRIAGDPEKCAAAVDLIYVSDRERGYRRQKKGDSFIYRSGNKIISQKNQLQRIRSLAIPPAWENVWICRIDNGHLQATGTDQKKRKQYRYHPLWNKFRNQTKFFRLFAFGQAIPQIRNRMKSDLNARGLSEKKVLAAAICLIERSSMRIGNEMYEKLYGTFGLTTLRDKHVRVCGSRIELTFRGKKGILHNIVVKDRELASIIQRCKDVPGRELFQYIDDEGRPKRIDSTMVNDYIRTICGQAFTAKDFRTWAGSVQALVVFRRTGGWKTKHEMKTKTNQALDEVAEHLGNTRAVCRKYYVHPLILSLFQSGKLEKYQREFDENCGPKNLTCEERLLLSILKKEVRSHSPVG